MTKRIVACVFLDAFSSASIAMDDRRPDTISMAMDVLRMTEVRSEARRQSLESYGLRRRL